MNLYYFRCRATAIQFKNKIGKLYCPALTFPKLGNTIFLCCNKFRVFLNQHSVPFSFSIAVLSVERFTQFASDTRNIKMGCYFFHPQRNICWVFLPMIFNHLE